MAEQVDLKIARHLMDEAIVLERDAAVRATPLFLLWQKRFEDFSALVKEAGYTTSIALVGAALIAKATNRRVDTMSLQASDTTPGAYSVRRPAESVLRPASLIGKFDIGSTSANPLNGQTFNKLKRIDLNLKIKGKRGQSLVKPLVDLLHEINHLVDQEDGVCALAAYIHVRRGYVPKYNEAPQQIGLVSAERLIEAIVDFVSQSSEGGGRAQAVVGGLLDTVYGPDYIRVGKPNEPDRKIAGDVIVRASKDRDSDAVCAFEVRDKLVSDVDLLSIVQKLQRTRVPRGAVVAVAANQKELDRGALAAAAKAAGVKVELYIRWTDLVAQGLFWTRMSEADAVQVSCKEIRARAVEMSLSSAGLDLWDRLTA